MLTEKDKIEQFKRDLRSYTYHQKKAVEIDFQIKELEVKKLGVSSPAIKDTVLENAGNPYSEPKLQYLIEEGELVEERSKHLAEIQRIDKALKLIDKEGKDILTYVFIDHKRYEDSVIHFNSSIGKLQRDIEKYITIILKNEEKMKVE